MKTQDVFDTLKTAVNQNDPATFHKEYIAFLQQYPSFKKAFTTAPSKVAVTSAIFGEHSFNLKQTEDDQARKILKEGNQASEVFSQLSVEERLEFLQLLREKIKDRQAEIVLAITADTGKPVDLSGQEMDKGDQWFNFSDKQALKQLGDAQDGAALTSSHPLGVAQVIGAYNYPYALAIGGIVGALAGGNSVVVSAPMKAPNWVFPFNQAAQEAIEAFSKRLSERKSEHAKAFAIHGHGLIQHSIGVNEVLTKESDVVHFVGSDRTGNIIKKARGDKKTILEMGGSNVVAVMRSAVKNEKDAETVAKLIYNGFGPATGQRCTAPRILCLQHGTEKVGELLKARCMEPDNMEIGNPFEKGIKIGPLVDAGAHQAMAHAIELARELGAEVHGDLPVNNNRIPQAGHSGSFWVRPVVIDWRNVDRRSPEKVQLMHECVKNEIFGPLLHIIHPVKDLRGAIDMTNMLDKHNLAGAIFTRDLQEVKRYRQGVKTVSLAHNGAPKDQSPDSVHGHPGRRKIGGANHFRLYVDNRAVADMGGLSM